MYYIYLIKSKIDNKLYIGYTNNLRRRFSEHNNKESKSTKFRAPFELIYYEAYKSENDAKDREKKLKYFGQTTRRLKERLIYSIK